MYHGTYQRLPADIFSREGTIQEKVRLCSWQANAFTPLVTVGMSITSWWKLGRCFRCCKHVEMVVINCGSFRFEGITYKPRCNLWPSQQLMAYLCTYFTRGQCLNLLLYWTLPIVLPCYWYNIFHGLEHYSKSVGGIYGLMMSTGDNRQGLTRIKPRNGPMIPGYSDYTAQNHRAPTKSKCAVV